MISSVIPGLVWPAIPNPQHAALLALQFQLEQSQWWSPGQIAAYQMQQANLLLVHAARTVPYYRDFLPDILAANRGSMDWAIWRQIPILQRADLQAHGQSLNSEQVPESHLPLSTGKTSGSTGRPVDLVRTRLTDAMWNAFTLRGHLWHGRDLSARLATIKIFAQPHPALLDQGLVLPTWGPATEMFSPRGDAVILSATVPVSQQWRWLKAQQPAYLLSYPSNLAALAEESLQQDVGLESLRGVISIGERLTAAQRQLCRAAWQLEIKDIYSAEEVGYIAHQSPQDESYLVQAEHVIVEVLDADGAPCLPGEVGQVVVTTLNNFARPLIRYALGDYARVGGPAACGRGLPVLQEIMGRQRNMLRLPDGNRIWPRTGFKEYAAVAPVLQHQLVQLDSGTVEVRLVVASPLQPEQEAALTGIIHQALRYPFRLQFRYYDAEIPRAANGKFEDFMSLLP